MTPPRLAISMGDPAGIGPEVLLKALAIPDVRAGFRPVVVGDLALLRSTAEQCGLDLVLVEHGPEIEEPAAIPVLDTDPLPSGFVQGEESATAGRAAYRYIETAVGLCTEGAADAIVTGPINKVALDLAGHGHEGHTEILQAMTGSPWSLTLFVLSDLRVLYLSRHLSLRDAIDAITAERIKVTLSRFAEAAPLVGLTDPRIAVAGLNPHAGEGGLFGTEEIDHIAPGVEQARALGLDVAGPVPADSVFHMARQGRYDVVLALYHDQAAIVTKTVDFHGTVSVTLGLPFLRFSVDHGTALDIAGRGIAEPDNMIATLRGAVEMTSASLAAR